MYFRNVYLLTMLPILFSFSYHSVTFFLYFCFNCLLSALYCKHSEGKTTSILLSISNFTRHTESKILLAIKSTLLDTYNHYSS